MAGAYPRALQPVHDACRSRTPAHPPLTRRSPAAHPPIAERSCQLAVKLIESMAALKPPLQPDAYSFAAAISACDRGRQPELALDLLQRMQVQAVLIAHGTPARGGAHSTHHVT